MIRATDTAKATMPAAIPPFAPLDRLFELVEAVSVLVEVDEDAGVEAVEEAVHVDC